MSGDIIVERGTKYYLDHYYEKYIEDDKRTYKHIVYCSSKFTSKIEYPDKIIKRDLSFIEINDLIGKFGKYSECLKKIFNIELIHIECSTDMLIEIRKYLIEYGYDGITTFNKNYILLFTERANIDDIPIRINQHTSIKNDQIDFLDNDGDI